MVMNVKQSKQSLKAVGVVILVCTSLSKTITFFIMFHLKKTTKASLRILNDSKWRK